MQTYKWGIGAVTMQIMVLAGCVPAVMAPTVTATPGPGKLPADLASDHAACLAQTNQQMATAVQAANNQVTATALQNVLTGTGANAVTVNAQATTTVQQQYDTAYSACMYAKGDNVPPYYMQPVVAAEPPPPVHQKRYAHKKPAATPAGASFVEPAPTASTAAGATGGSGSFVEPTPASTAPAPSTAPAAAGGGFAEPPPVSH
jgi:hypothetical protein